jgi:hypothetical protein
MPETAVVVEVSSDSDITRGGEEGAAMVSVLRFADRQSDRFPRPLHLEDSVIGVAREADRGHRFLVATALPIGDSAHYRNDLCGEMLTQKRLPLGTTSNG